MKVKFYDAGGHSGNAVPTDAPGIEREVGKERLATIKNDGSDKLRSPFGTPQWYDSSKDSE